MPAILKGCSLRQAMEPPFVFQPCSYPLFPNLYGQACQNADCSQNSILSLSSMKNLTVEPRPYLAMGEGPHHKNNRVAARYQLSHIANSWDGKRSANFHTPNWEVIWYWILNYLKKKRKMSPRNIPRTLPPTSRCQYLTFKSFWGPSAARTLSLCKSWTRAEKKVQI